MKFIPGHRGLSGNEAADSAAKAAHLLRYRTLTPYSKEETLNNIQNHILRLATGCRKTSPAALLEVEAVVFPLSIYRDLLTCQYYSKFQQISNEIADNLLQAQFPSEGVSLTLLPSMTSRARAFFTNVNLLILACNAVPLVSPLPPWIKVETNICTDFLFTSVSSLSNQNVLQMYHELIDTNYSGYTHIFTDGSCIVEPTCSSSAAVVIPSRGVTINFKLRPQIHIMECELIAINEALQWILLNNCPEEKYVIFSDSLSSLHLMQNTRPKNYLPLVFNIQDKLFNIASSHGVYLQFIPGHKGIPVDMGECRVISCLVVGSFCVEVKAVATDGCAGGLVLNWTALTTNKEGSRILLSKFAKSAILFPGELSHAQVKALISSGRASGVGHLFGSATPLEDVNLKQSSPDHASCALALTDTGDLLLILFEGLCCQVFSLGRLTFPVVWVGTVHDGSARLVCAVQHSGVLHLCQPTATVTCQATGCVRFAWKALPLISRVVAVSTSTNSVVTSDGFHLHIYTLKIENTKLCSKICSCFSCLDITQINKIVKFAGVVSLSCSSSKIWFTTVDGRHYCKSWGTFLSRAQPAESDTNSAHVKIDHVDHDITLDSTLKEMRSISELTSRTQAQSDKLNCYVKQLNMAQNLWSFPSSTKDDDYFNLEYNVHSCADPGYDYRLKFQLSIKKKRMELVEEWWRVRIAVPDGLKTRFISAPFSDQHCSFVIRLTLKEVNFLVFSPTKGCRPRLKLDLVFMHYNCSRPLVCIAALQLKLCVWKFLSEKQNFTTLSSEGNSPLESHLKCHGNIQNGADVCTGVLPHRFLIQCPSSNEFLSNFCDVLRIKEMPNESSFKLSKLFFYGSHGVMVKVYSALDVVKIDISSSSAIIGLALRKNLSELGQKFSVLKSRKITIDVPVVEQIFSFQYFLDASAEDSKQISNVRKLCSDLDAIVGALPH
ncbi:Ribonuclease H domain [Trinorchestia longiramus]|nr:Ribonuclease H domain [Trinorchestia longiramus]